MPDTPGCKDFNSDAAYCHALISNNRQLVENACKCLMESYRAIPEMILHKLGFDSRDEKHFENAADAYSDAVTIIIYKIKTGGFDTGRSKISTYLYAICKNVFLSNNRKSALVSSLEDMPETQLQTQTAINLQVAEEQEKEFSAKLALIKKAVSELRKGCADSLYRLLYLNETREQIAAGRGAGVPGLATEISRCKNELKEHLISKYNFNQDGLWL